MGDLLDIISSTLIAGMLLLSVLKINSALTSTNSDTSAQVITQENATTIANTVVHDFYKIGYKASPGIIFADTSAITFLSEIDNDGVVDTISYSLSAPLSGSGINPNWRILDRTKDGQGASGASLGVTSFDLAYYDSTGDEISIPAGGTTAQSTLSRIRSIRIEIMFQSANETASGYAETYWEQYISPENLRTLM